MEVKILYISFIQKGWAVYVSQRELLSVLPRVSSCTEINITSETVRGVHPTAQQTSVCYTKAGVSCRTRHSNPHQKTYKAHVRWRCDKKCRISCSTYTVIACVAPSRKLSINEIAISLIQNTLEYVCCWLLCLTRPNTLHIQTDSSTDPHCPTHIAYTPLW